jgi:pimeloyl-ACP methyl ester carboxylesterase
MMQAVIDTLNGTPVRAWKGGQGGTPLVFLHGFEQHPGAAPFLSKLAASRPVLAPEHPGFGASGGASEMAGILDLVLHYRQWLEPLVAEHGPVDLMGHSLGGMFAAEIAAIFPHLVRRLVLVDAYGLWLDDVPMPDPFVIPAPQLDAAKWADPATWAGAEPNSHDGAAADYVYYRSANLGAASRFMWPIPDRGLSRRLPLIRAETLVVHGERDGLVPPAYADAFARAIPGARTAIIAKAGHLPMIEQEAAFLDAVGGFLG